MYLQPSFLVVYEAEIHFDAIADRRAKQPGNNIDVYLKPLIEELLMMWNDGVEVWDEDKREAFTLRAMLFVTIQDLPTLGSLSGQAVKGFNGCVKCMDDTSGVWLKNYKKVVYIGTRRFLRPDHPFRRKIRDLSMAKQRLARLRYFMMENRYLQWSRM